MERWIARGRVRVNDAAATLGQRVGTDDRIVVDGKPLRRRKTVPAKVLLYNKPVGEICTRSDPEGRPTVFDRLPGGPHGRWISIGRLDIATGGLLLLTTDGELANRMMHPSTGLDREYAVRVNGRLSEAQREMLMTGILDDGEELRFSDIQYYDGRGTNHWYHVVLVEGRNREIRRLFEHCGLMVSRLKRVRFGPLVLPSRLLRGRYEYLSDEDLRELYALLKLPLAGAGGQPPRKGRGRPRRTSVLIPYPAVDV